MPASDDTAPETPRNPRSLVDGGAPAALPAAQSWLPVGRRGVLLDLDSGREDEPAALARAVRRLADELDVALSEVVPGAATLLVLATGPEGLQLLLAALPGLAAGAGSGSDSSGSDSSRSDSSVSDSSGPVVEIAVRYDGPDLQTVADAAGLSVPEVVRLHSSGTYRAAFTGFAPGFAYLTGLDPALRLPRRDSPRSAVPAGSLAVADAYTAVYPRRSPGGWHLLGTVDAQMFDLGRNPPALVSPGQAVRFRELS